MAPDSPFYSTKVECPICKTVNEFETVRVGAYIEQGRDTDFCPLEVKWRYPKYQANNPLAYFTATCSNCFYTREFNNAFRDWQKDSQFRSYRQKPVKERHLEQLATSDSVVKALGGRIDMAGRANEAAILKLLLAARDELFAPHPSKLDLGRFYLRIGWVFRDLEKGEDPSLRVVRSLTGELENRASALADVIHKGRDELGVFERHVGAHLETNDLPAAVQKHGLAFKERLTGCLESLRRQVDGGRTAVGELLEVVNQYRQEALGSDTADGANGSDMVGFLSELRPDWEGIVTCEQEALGRAAQYYREAFEEGRDIAPGYQQLQATYLIAELSRRVADYDTARQYFNATIKAGQEFIYRNRQDRSRTALARKILELAIEQGRVNMEELKS